MGEATISKDATTIDVITPAAGYASGEVIQLSDGRAAQVVGLKALVEGDPAALKPDGQVTLAKTASVVILEGAPLYWDRSAGTCTPLKAVAGGDFFCGVAVKDAASADATVLVNLNVQPQYTIDLLRDPLDEVLSGDATLKVHGGTAVLALIATSEVEKSDAISKHSIPVVSGSAIPFIVEGRMAGYGASANTVDINVGLANATHATDAEAITEAVFLHLDEVADLNIFVHSDDGTTEVALTDTTINYVEDTYFDFAFDCRDLTDIQIYINGVLILPDTVFALGDATGPIKLLAHIEKTTGTATGEVRVSKLALRATDLAA
jgi:predicted RecA/RadA family phage recombinase